MFTAGGKRGVDSGASAASDGEQSLRVDAHGRGAGRRRRGTDGTGNGGQATVFGGRQRHLGGESGGH